MGEASFATLDGVIFANMVEADGKSGNIIGTTNENVKVANAYCDSRISRTENKEDAVTALTTEKLIRAKVNGFVSLGGYPVPETIAKNGSAKFATGVQFAAMTVRYLAFPFLYQARRNV